MRAVNVKRGFIFCAWTSTSAHEATAVACGTFASCVIGVCVCVCVCVFKPH